MNKLLLVLMSLFSCNAAFASEPKLSKGDHVRYPVPTFYKNVCNGPGEVISYEIINAKGDIAYLVQTEPGCPNFRALETDLMLIPSQALIKISTLFLHRKSSTGLIAPAVNDMR